MYWAQSIRTFPSKTGKSLWSLLRETSCFQEKSWIKGAFGSSRGPQAEAGHSSDRLQVGKRCLHASPANQCPHLFFWRRLRAFRLPGSRASEGREACSNWEHQTYGLEMIRPEARLPSPAAHLEALPPGRWRWGAVATGGLAAGTGWGDAGRSPSPSPSPPRPPDQRRCGRGTGVGQRHPAATGPRAARWGRNRSHRLAPAPFKETNGAVQQPGSPPGRDEVCFWWWHRWKITRPTSRKGPWLFRPRSPSWCLSG